MKKYYLILFVFVLIPRFSFCYTCCYGDEFVDHLKCDRGNEFTSRTFMLTRPVSQSLAADQSLWHDFIYDKHDHKDSLQSSFQLIGFYQGSICREETTKYFLFDFKSCLRVLGDQKAIDDNGRLKGFRDIRAEWLGLPSDFQGAFTVDPKQKQMGVVIEFNQNLKKFSDSDLFKRFWFSAIFPLVYVQNNMNLCQFDVFNQGQDCPKDIVEAFRQCDWRFSKIGGKQSRFSVTPIEIKFGGAYLSDGNNQIVQYSTILIPIGEEDENRYLFEPTVGYNGHLGYGTGVNFQFVLNRDNDFYDFCFFLNLEGVFLIRNRHYRTFDLKGKCTPCGRGKNPWSRYLLFNKKDGPPNLKVPGVNVLTKYVRVRPYNMVDFSIGWRVKGDNFELELGYNIWGHGAERIECIKKFKDEWGIAGVSQPGDDFARSASLSTIGELKATPEEDLPADEDPVFVSICASDLDLDSAASQGALNHKFHFAGGFERKGESVDSFFGGGLYYEIPQKNSALKNWGIWVKMGGSF